MGNETLITLDLGGNNVGSEGIKILAAAIRDSLTLRSLDLSYNPIGADGAAAISDVCKYDLKVFTLKSKIFQSGV